jgi:endogenous inhibitor of DNA gyrase (YacG/DUF329 family)
MVRTVRCPICKSEVPINDPNMPFCSDRCRLIDLGNWASDKYAIPVKQPNEFRELEEADIDLDDIAPPHPGSIQ